MFGGFISLFCWRLFRSAVGLFGESIVPAELLPGMGIGATAMGFLEGDGGIAGGVGLGKEVRGNGGLLATGGGTIDGEAMEGVGVGDRLAVGDGRLEGQLGAVGV